MTQNKWSWEDATLNVYPVTEAGMNAWLASTSDENSKADKKVKKAKQTETEKTNAQESQESQENQESKDVDLTLA